MKKFAVIGSPISHSFSPKIHSEFAKNSDLKITYDAIEVKKNNFEKRIKELFDGGYEGINVTLPLKELAYKFADEVSELGKIVGAANTLWRQENKIFADTTDGRGLVQDLENNSLPLEKSSILLIGAGGSARSILPSIISRKPKEITIINRTERKAESLVKLFSSKNIPMKSSGLNKANDNVFSGIINTSSAGMLGEEILLPTGIFNSVKWTYDLSYSLQTTPFNLLVKKNGVSNYFDGLGMLVHQAAISFEIWTGIKPDTKRVIDYLKHRKVNL